MLPTKFDGSDPQGEAFIVMGLALNVLMALGWAAAAAVSFAG